MGGKNKINVDNILCCSAGGIGAVFFTIGVIKKLLDDDKFLNNFDVISAVSGSVIPISFIELCYDNNLINEKDWYEKYVVNPIHEFFKSDYIMNIFISTISMISDYNNSSSSNILWKELSSIYKNIPKLKQSQKSKKIKKPIFCYNYINSDSFKLSYDNTDLKDDLYKFSKIIIRCTCIFNNINNILSFDAAILNMFGTNVLDNFKPKNITICSKINYFNKEYENFEKNSFLYHKFFINAFDYTNKLLTDTNLFIITISSSKYPSNNKYHLNIFKDTTIQFQSIKLIYYMKYELSMIFENEGYIQCHEMLKLKQNEKNNKNSIYFKIPNKSVYKKAKKIIKKYTLN